MDGCISVCLSVGLSVCQASACMYACLPACLPACRHVCLYACMHAQTYEHLRKRVFEGSRTYVAKMPQLWPSQRNGCSVLTLKASGEEVTPETLKHPRCKGSALLSRFSSMNLKAEAVDTEGQKGGNRCTILFPDGSTAAEFTWEMEFHA